MISYNNNDIIQCLRQYEMFASSLKLISNPEEKNMIVKQLTKLENKILSLTNDIYEEEYNTLANKKCGLLDEEKERLTMLIDLINQRLSYVEKRCNDHYTLTGESIDAISVLGASELDSLEDRIKIIDKYNKNTKLEKELKGDIKSLSSKIDLASEKIDINKSLNVELEVTFKKVMAEAFEKLGFYALLDARESIEYAYQETEKSLTLAELNLESAKTSPANILEDCQKMLDEVNEDYNKYKEQMSILRLMEMFNRDVNTYNELLNKRKEVNEIIKYIKNIEFLSMVMDTVNKQYNTILMEQQDINTYDDLVLEKERKMEALSEIQSENNSEEFQNVLKVLIENEKKKQEKILEEQRRVEELEKQKRLELERKRQEEILKRQKIIEEARKKEIEKRTKQLLFEQQKSVLQNRKKDIPTNNEENIINNERELESNNINVVEENIKPNINNNVPLFKNKVDIEKELFEEFNNQTSDTTDGGSTSTNKEAQNSKNNYLEDSLFEKKDEYKRETKLPDVSLDEYMKNFNDKKIEEVSDLFDDTSFPSIPI